MNLRRIYAIIYMNMIVMKRNWFRLFDITLWPVTLFVSLILFVRFMGTRDTFVAIAVMGLVGWRAVYHFQIESSVAYMDNYWGRMLPHTLSSPLKMSEFVIANLIMGLFKFILVLIMYLLLAYFMVGFTVPNVGLFIFGIIFLAISGFIIGLITFGFTMLYHENAITVTYVLPDLFCLASGVYYPITVFPLWLQNVVHILPTFYGFEILKSMVGYGTIDYLLMFIVLAIWFVFALWFVSYAARKARRHGLSGKFN